MKFSFKKTKINLFIKVHKGFFSVKEQTFQTTFYIIKMNNIIQSSPQKGTMNSQLSMSYYQNTTNRKQSFKKSKINRKSSFLDIYEPKNYFNIIENANNQLQEYLFNLNEHIKKIIQKRQASYLTAYENHLKAVQRQLKRIKKKCEDNNSKQKNISLQQVISRLQKQCQIFRYQALRYFYILQQKEQQLKTIKRDYEIIKRQLQVSDFTKKKLFQQLKINLVQGGDQNKQLLRDQIKFFQSDQFIQKEFKKSKQRNYTQRSLNANNSKLNTKNYKFRKTLLDFDLKNSNELYKQTPRKSARSLLTNSTVIRDDFKIPLQNNLKQSKLLTQQKLLTSTNYKSPININKSSNSLIKINNFRTLEVNEQKINQITQNFKNLSNQQFRNSFKDILFAKFHQIHKINTVQLINCQLNWFKFNSESQINNFITNLFDFQQVKKCSQAKIDRYRLKILQNQNINSINRNIKDLPFQRMSSLKRQGNMVQNSIYTVQKKQKQQKLVDFVDCQINMNQFKPPTISKKSSNVKWIYLKLNKNKNHHKSRLQKNLSCHLEKQTHYQ